MVLENGSIVQMVQEGKRAWHAGVSVWGGDTDINSRSIGIEVCNPGHDFGYPDFPSRQIAATITLCRSILTRNIIRPENIVAHSDVAPSRKNDPGEKFPWKLFAQSGVGLWVEAGSSVDGETLRPNDSGTKVTELQTMLGEYGYGIDAAPATMSPPPRPSPPSSGTSANRRLTASPIPSPSRSCGSY